ncbi:MAG: nicotinamide riboside transporter PnuC [Porcipelethomonas sp.]
MIAVSNILSGEINLLTLITAWVGITSLIFAAKGNVWSQILMIVFSILYGIISWQSRYWGEMITYLGMTMPMAIWSTITWIKNPSKNGNEVAIQKLTKQHIVVIVIFGTITTVVFYFILCALDTPNIMFSTISITTSFIAASLTILRTSYYALGYASNDIVLIILWGLASIDNPVYITVVVNFIIFFLNDMYGFICWKKREIVQR